MIAEYELDIKPGDEVIHAARGSHWRVVSTSNDGQILYVNNSIGAKAAFKRSEVYKPGDRFKQALVPPTEPKIVIQSAPVQEFAAGKLRAERTEEDRRARVAAARTREELQKLADEFGYRPQWVEFVLKGREQKGRA